MVIVQSTGNPAMVTRARIQKIRNVVTANGVIDEDVAVEVTRIDSGLTTLREKEALDEIDNDLTLTESQREKAKKEKVRELATLSAYMANRGFRTRTDVLARS